MKKFCLVHTGCYKKKLNKFELVVNIYYKFHWKIQMYGFFHNLKEEKTLGLTFSQSQAAGAKEPLSTSGRAFILPFATVLATP